MPSAPTDQTTDLPSLVRVLGQGIPKPRPKQFETPDSVIRFTFEKIASRDMGGALVAFPAAEYYERVRLKDVVKFIGVMAPSTYPLDDDQYGRFNHALVKYLGDYRQISLKVLSDDSGGAITVTEANTASVLREFDGGRLNALQVLAIKDTHPESPPKISPIDEAMGVTEKLLREVRVKLEDREVVVIAIVGRIGDNWRVLSLF
ncbi:MAG TPA: hypothetical protein VHP33_37155 [Polyangiaceae bacterium]|nr:hypothetical protein [Polyangiaceae bacterium]